MEPDGEERSPIGPKVVHLDLELFSKVEATSPPEDPDEQEYKAHVAFWESILGFHPRHWTWTTDQVSECYRSLIEEDVLRNAAKYRKEDDDYCKRIQELNKTSSPFLFTTVDILPRSPSPRCFHTWHRQFKMTNTNPTSVGSMRFTQTGGAYEYTSSQLLQFFSMRFAGDFSHGQRMSIYGFMAVRDEVDQLRNYIFNRPREHAQEITADSPDLLLTPPTRGISASHDVVVEYSLKVKGNGCDDTKHDEEFINGCFMFREDSGCDTALRKVRLFGSVGPLDIHFVTMKWAVEATVEVNVKRAMPGCSLSMVAASTCGYEEEITPYDRSAPMEEPKDGSSGSSSSVTAVAHAVVAVEVGCYLKLRFEIGTDDARKSSHELLFTARAEARQ
ncbi:unnamed protein product [Urochloa decumbens]|uniref:DUF6598 domain-containing protein n=1 Tax=Urochloa decumbens TaxID=240449 RepID=A0ABC8VGU2_9POAL